MICHLSSYFRTLTSGSKDVIHLRARMQTHTCTLYTRVIYLDECTKHMHTYVHTCIHTYIHTYIHAYICTYKCTYVHTYKCIGTYVRTYARTHAITHTHTYALTTHALTVCQILTRKNLFVGKKTSTTSLELSVGFPLFVKVSGQACKCEDPNKHTEFSKFTLTIIMFF